MPKTAKVAISLPEDVLNNIEKERKARGESRSEFFRKAVERELKSEKESSAIRAYIQGYKKMPETTEEIAMAQQTALVVFSAETWK